MDAPKVQRGEAVTADAWNRIVELVNGTLDCSIKRTRRPQTPDTIQLRLVYLKQAWTKIRVDWKQSMVWHTTANFYKNGRVDTSETIDVYAPAANSNGPSAKYPGDLYVANLGGVWCSIESSTVFIPAVYPGNGIYVGSDGSGNYVVENRGIREGKIPGQNYSDWGTLYFDKRFFQWIGSTLDIVSKNEISLKTRFVTVVTGKNADGSLKTDIIEVLARS